LRVPVFLLLAEELVPLRVLVERLPVVVERLRPAVERLRVLLDLDELREELLGEELLLDELLLDVLFFFVEEAPPFLPPFLEEEVSFFFPRPEPLFLPPLSCLFTVAQARRSASSLLTPRFS